MSFTRKAAIHQSMNHKPLRLVVSLAVIFSFHAFLLQQAAQAQSTPVTAGYRDFNFGSGVDPTLTGEKPQSKLWWNDGYWWGSLWDPSMGKYAIYKLNFATQSWSSTGVAIDDRGTSRADALWDGQRLYIASNVFADNSGGSTSSSQSARLYRYSYNSSTKTYALDSGFPVNVNSSKSETLVIDKDSTGQLWVTWTENSKVKVNRSTTNDQTWGTPFDLPVQGANISSDDISTLIAFDGKIGLMWSNQNDKKIYFAIHRDSDADNTWQAKETSLADGNGGPIADDHINIKLSGDSNGNLYAVTKSSFADADGVKPGVYFIKRAISGGWSSYEVGKNTEDHTRPILLIDNGNQKAYVFAKAVVNGNDVIVMKSSSLGTISFPQGLGTPFIQSSTDKVINNPTSTKQWLDGARDLVVLASDESSKYYLHNYIDLSGGSSTPTISSFTPSSGAVGTEITIAGANFTSVTSVKFNGTAAANYVVNSSTQIHATVPSGATTGKISVITANGTAVSANDFTVIGSGNTLTFNPVHDTYVRLSKPTSNYGTASTVRQRKTSSDDINTYVKFEVSGLSGAVQSAKLRLRVSDAGNDGGAVYHVSNDYANSSSSWIETGMNWNNAPAISGSALSSVGAVSLDSWAEWDVTAVVTGNSTYSFALSNNSSDEVRFSSKQGANKPELVIQIGSSTPPAPSITSFSPASGPVGTEVTISGSNFSGATGVKFNGTPATTFFVDSNTSIRANAPSGSTTGKISVTTDGGTATSADNFTVTTSSTVVATFTPVGDAPVYLSNPTTNYGANDRLGAIKSAVYNITSYLKFDVTGLSEPVQSAKLRLRVIDGSNDAGTMYQVSNNYQSSSTPWDEAGIIWNNAPAISGSPLSSAGSAGANQTVEFDVTSAISGNGTYSFGLKNNSSDFASFSSKEGANVPELIIETTSGTMADNDNISGLNAARPMQLMLFNAFPNPFNAQTAIEYYLPEASRVQLVIYNALGQVVRTLLDAEQPAGLVRAIWDGKDEFGAVVGSGVYFYRISVGSQRLTGRMILQQ
jgi:hypothetical protein